jgi:3-carboxy-cis,cis-muconate cycloisomerase
VEQVCHRASTSGRHLKDELAADPAVGRHLSPADLDRLFDPANYLGLAADFTDRVLARRRKIRP